MENQLTIKNQDGKLLVDSREVAEMTGKRHDHLLADIRKYVEILDSQDFGSHEFFIESTYLNSQNKAQPCYLLTRKGCDMVANKMTGEKGVLFTAAYVTKFEEMEQQLQPKLPQTYKEALLALVAAEEEKERLQLQIEENKPLVSFAETALKSKDIILVRELTKIAQDQKINIGEKRLWKKLREWNLILSGKTEPSQYGMNLKLFEVVERTVDTPYGPKLESTTKVTPKGQVYIIERLKKELNKS